MIVGSVYSDFGDGIVFFVIRVGELSSGEGFTVIYGELIFVCLGIYFESWRVGRVFFFGFRGVLEFFGWGLESESVSMGFFCVFFRDKVKGLGSRAWFFFYSLYFRGYRFF